MASETTVLECGGAVEFRELDLVAVKGRETPVTVYEVLAPQGEMPPERAALRGSFALGLDLYRRGRFRQAAAAFNAVLEQSPEDGPSQTFLNRCQQLQAAPPPAPWDTVFRPDAK